MCDKAIALMGNIDSFLKQTTKEKIDFDETINSLNELGRLAGV